jgi:hypothetical protein
MFPREMTDPAPMDLDNMRPLDIRSLDLICGCGRQRGQRRRQGSMRRRACMIIDTLKLANARAWCRADSLSHVVDTRMA